MASIVHGIDERHIKREITRHTKCEPPGEENPYALYIPEIVTPVTRSSHVVYRQNHTHVQSLQLNPSELLSSATY